ncbi:MAG TPA: helix-turn-helix transcriptional regulator [Caulobacterales bacterium]|nr:helix-turn-helix transcriptional regulator [Caulobacterales bacterium]
MRSESEAARLVDRIYAAIRDPRIWSDVVPEIAGWLGADMGMMTSPSLPGHEAVPIFLHRMDLSPVQNNPLMWRAEFTLRAIATGRTPGVFLFDELMQREEQSTNEYWQGVVAPLGIGSGLLGVIRTADDNQKPVILNYYRRVGAPPFVQGDADALALLLPHLRRSLGILLDAPPVSDPQMGAFYDSLGAAAFLFGADGKLLHRNPAADILLGAKIGLALESGRLVLADKEAQLEFEGALKRVVGENWTRKLRIGSELLAQPASGGSPLVFVVTPIGAENPIAQWAAPVRCVVFVLEEKLRPDATLETRLRRLYGLTSAEAQVGIGIAAGASLPELARQRGTRPSTIRAQLKGAMAKTLTRRQSQLAAMITRLRI